MEAVFWGGLDMRGGEGYCRYEGKGRGSKNNKQTNKQTKPPQEPPKQTPLNASSSLNATRNGAVTEQATLIAFLRRGVSKGDDGGVGESGERRVEMARELN